MDREAQSGSVADRIEPPKKAFLCTDSVPWSGTVALAPLSYPVQGLHCRVLAQCHLGHDGSITDL